jgi:ubiquinone/menaquinone biosynthesis C-methylase UbiE
MIMNTFTDGVKKNVLEMYMRHPYPSYSKEERRNIFAAELCRYRYLGLEPFMFDARVIDVGCGTGHRVMPLAKHFGVKEYIGLDHSSASLGVADKLAKELGLESVTLVEGDLFNIPYSDDSFDIVISQGVLHHTSDPYRGFLELVRICRPNGFVNVFLYNKWNHWRHNLQKQKINRLAGDNLEKRFEVAHRLYGTKPVEAMTPAEVAGFYDQYCHPHKSDHAIGEIFDWFKEKGLMYWGSYPPLRFRDFVAMAQYRGALIEDYSYFHTVLAENIVKMLMHLPSIGRTSPPFRKPTSMHQVFWQMMYALQGSRGKYSGGASLCGRKAVRIT